MNRALILVSFVMAACEVGEVPTNNGTGIDAPVTTHPDAPTTPTPDAPIAAACAPRANPVTQAHIHSAGATTHAGENCLQGGCHLATNVGVGASGFQFGGTLYGIDGVTANAGATLSFTKMAGGTPLTTTTDTAGNFHIAAGALPQAFPALTSATVCTTGSTTGPAPTAMTTPLANTDGACARSGCHTPGAGQGAIKLDPTI